MINETDIAGLPAPVARCLRNAGVIGTKMPDGVIVEQRGRIRSSPETRWLSFSATEEYGVREPSFVWRAALRIAGVPVGRATDSLSDSGGRMHVRLLGMFDAVDETGPEMDQGSVMRWLNETMWFPAVWTSGVITWTPVDDHAAVGSVTVGDVAASAEFRFDGDGKLIDFVTDRYRTTPKGFVLTPWSTPLTNHRRFESILLPASGTADWLLDDGRFPYIEIEVEDVRYTYDA